MEEINPNPIVMFITEILYNIYCMEMKQEVGIFSWQTW